MLTPQSKAKRPAPTATTRALSLVIAAVLSFAPALGCKHGGCDQAQLANLERVLNDPTLDAMSHLNLGLEGLHEACGEHLPSDFDHSLAALAQVDPADRGTIMAAGIKGSSSFAKAACPEFERTFGAVASAAAASKARVMYDGCGYQRLGLFTADEFDAVSKQDFASAMATPMLYVWLTEHGVEQGRARALIRKIESLR